MILNFNFRLIVRSKLGALFGCPGSLLLYPQRLYPALRPKLLGSCLVFRENRGPPRKFVLMIKLDPAVEERVMLAAIGSISKSSFVSSCERPTSTRLPHGLVANRGSSFLLRSAFAGLRDLAFGSTANRGLIEADEFRTGSFGLQLV